MRKYPHMMPSDHQTWSRALELLSGRMRRVWYDVHVGQAVEVPAGAPDYLHRVAAGVTRKRIDVVADLGAGLWVIEVKSWGSHQAIGQARLYYDLFVKEFEVGVPVYGVVVCDQVDPDIVATAQGMGVQLWATGFTLGDRFEYGR